MGSGFKSCTTLPSSVRMEPIPWATCPAAADQGTAPDRKEQDLLPGAGTQPIEVLCPHHVCEELDVHPGLLRLKN